MRADRRRVSRDIDPRGGDVGAPSMGSADTGGTSARVSVDAK
jgi:hypothetical protein